MGMPLFCAKKVLKISVALKSVKK